MIYVLLAVALVSQVACEKSDKINRPMACVDGQASDVGIIGGKTLSKDAWLAKGMVALITTGVDRWGDDTYSLCTGTLITRNIVLTAAHCVDDRKNMEAKSVTVLFGIEPRCDLAKSDRSQVMRKADKVVHHEGYGDGLGEFDDLALVRISEEAPAEYHTVALASDFTRLESSQKIYLAGYGQEVEYTDTTSELTSLKYAEVHPFVNDPAKTSQIFPSTYNNDGPTMLFDQSRGQGACAGDSGGPSLIKSEYGLKVLGVASRVVRLDRYPNANDDATCKQGSLYTSVYYYRGWIETNRQKILAN